MLAVKFTVGCYRAPQGSGNFYRGNNRFAIRRWQRAWVGQAYGANICIRRFGKRIVAARTKHLAARVQLNMNFKADNGNKF